MNEYEAKQQARKERLEARAAALKAAGQARVNSGMDRLRAIPFGQPILVGHYSEKRDRNYRRKAGLAIDAGFALQKQAEQLADRAASVGLGGISSDDPDAPQKLAEQLAELEAKQRRMKDANAAWRKEGHKAGRQVDGTWLDAPYPSYSLSNLSANMRRIKGRIAELARNSTRETKETERPDGVRIVENAEANRLQIFFPGKPAAEMRDKLKKAGFRWAPSEGAWQRQLNNAARYAAQYALS